MDGTIFRLQHAWTGLGVREIDLSNNRATNVHALVLGPPKSGKTHFAASAPAPLFISDAAEGGYVTIASMDPEYFWDRNKPPTVWAIEDAFKDLPGILARLEKLKAENTFPYRTLVIDPISIYADRVIAEMMMRNSSDPKANNDKRALYGDLANHLRVLLLRVHALPCHVLWLCHVKEGGVSLAGQTADKLPAYMDFTWLCSNSPGIGYELHTAPYGVYSILGGRYTWANAKGKRYGLPSPIIPSFKAISQVMKLGQAPSPSMPGFPEGANYNWPPEES